ncbi:hypothetical protein ACKAV7_008409 [Fusarium commune]
MKASPFVVSLAFVSIASATCLGDVNHVSPGWGDKQRVLDAVRAACKEDHQPALAGSYSGYEYKETDEKITDTISVNFMIRYSGAPKGQPGSLSESQCIEWLQREVELCDVGGQSYYVNGDITWMASAEAFNSTRLKDRPL